MKVYGAISCLSLMMLVSGAYAQIDTDLDGLGLYFDQGATLVSASVAEGTETVTAYLILTNPSVEGFLVHWAARVVGGCGWSGYAMVAGSPTVGSNWVLNMPGSGHWVFEVNVSPEELYPVANVTILAEITIWLGAYDVPIGFCVAPGDEFAFYATDQGGTEFHPSSGSWDLPVATLNGPAPVAVERQTWGQIKSVFR